MLSVFRRIKDNFFTPFLFPTDNIFLLFIRSDSVIDIVKLSSPTEVVSLVFNRDKIFDFISRDSAVIVVYGGRELKSSAEYYSNLSALNFRSLLRTKLDFLSLQGHIYRLLLSSFRPGTTVGKYFSAYKRDRLINTLTIGKDELLLEILHIFQHSLIGVITLPELLLDFYLSSSRASMKLWQYISWSAQDGSVYEVLSLSGNFYFYQLHISANKQENIQDNIPYTIPSAIQKTLNIAQDISTHGISTHDISTQGISSNAQANLVRTIAFTNNHLPKHLLITSDNLSVLFIDDSASSSSLKKTFYSNLRYDSLISAISRLQLNHSYLFGSLKKNNYLLNSLSRLRSLSALLFFVGLLGIFSFWGWDLFYRQDIAQLRLDCQQLEGEISGLRSHISGALFPSGASTLSRDDSFLYTSKSLEAIISDYNSLQKSWSFLRNLNQLYQIAKTYDCEIVKIKFAQNKKLALTLNYTGYMEGQRITRRQYVALRKAASKKIKQLFPASTIKFLKKHAKD